MKPILPTSVSLENRWYNEHLVYTHVPEGFLTLEATDGQIVDSESFSNKEKFTMVKVVYLNKHGLVILLHEVLKVQNLVVHLIQDWEVLDVSPPLSWIFEPNFLLSFPGESVHIMRYKDVNDRMQTCILISSMICLVKN